ncbi:MAG: hypothetical protein FJX62_20215 [Alphaproteobacteria bacterium]|nr:hypothetical protein [Alphaproteobacteria bacterium]
MLRNIALTVALAAGFVSATLVAQANAMPLSLGKAAERIQSNILEIRDGCGRGYHRVRGRCVPEIRRPPRCGRGMRWSERRGRCVRD